MKTPKRNLLTTAVAAVAMVSALGLLALAQTATHGHGDAWTICHVH